MEEWLITKEIPRSFVTWGDIGVEIREEVPIFKYVHNRLENKVLPVELSSLHHPYPLEFWPLVEYSTDRLVQNLKLSLLCLPDIIYVVNQTRPSCFCHSSTSVHYPKCDWMKNMNGEGLGPFPYPLFGNETMLEITYYSYSVYHCHVTVGATSWSSKSWIMSIYCVLCHPRQWDL